MKKIKYIIFVFFIFTCLFAYAEEQNSDLTLLIKKISLICGNRWKIELKDNQYIYITSKEKGHGHQVDSGQSLFEDHYTYYRFTIVKAMTVEEIENAERELVDLQSQASSIKQEEMKGYIQYSPENDKEKALVLAISKAKEKVEDIPEYKYKSICLSVAGYLMNCFEPKEGDPIGLQYQEDLINIEQLLEKVN